MNFIDWIMWLPEELEKGFWQEVRTYEEVEKVPHVLGAVRIAKEEGLKLGLQQNQWKIYQATRLGFIDGIELGLEVKFGQLGLKLMADINKIHDIEFLKSFRNRLRSSDTFEDIERICQLFVQKPRQQALQYIYWGLELKFGQEGLELLPEIVAIEDVTILQSIQEKLKEIDTLEALTEYYREYLPENDNEAA